MFKLNTPLNSRQMVPVTVPASLAITEGTLYALSTTTGVLAAAGTSTVAGQPLFLAQASYAASTSAQEIPMLLVSDQDLYVADTVNNSNATHNGQRMIFDATGGKLNNTGTNAATGALVQIAAVGAAANKKVYAVKA
jgi:hypothetical protein